MTAEFQIPTGIAVRSGSVLCVDTLNLTHGGPAGVTAIVHGYFAPDK